MLYYAAKDNLKKIRDEEYIFKYPKNISAGCTYKF